MDKLEPKGAVHKYCTMCVCGDRQYNSKEVENCTGDQAWIGPCPFYHYRMGDKRVPPKVFKSFCQECYGDNEQINCQVEKCPCWPYRQGKNPALAGKGTPANLIPGARWLVGR